MNSASASITVRRMTLDDMPGVMEIDRLSLPMPWSERSFRFEISENRDSCLLLAERSVATREVVGFVGFWMLLDEAHISTIAVHPDLRRQGIGRALLLEAIREAVAREAVLVTLEVRQSNHSAIQLYRSLGFEIVGRRVRYYKDNQEDALLMTLHDPEEAIAAADGGEV